MLKGTFDRLKPNEQLPLSVKLLSAHRDFYAIINRREPRHLQYSLPNYHLWASNTDGQAVTQCIMQTDGNLVIYNGSHPNWSTNTYGNPGAFAIMQDDGNFVIYDGTRVLWASNSDIML